MTSGLQGIIAGLWIVLASGSAVAQAMSDPMRPPNEYMSKSEMESEAAAADAGGQIVILSRDRKIASINGDVIALGGRYRDGRLVSISEDELVLRGSGTLETIKLYSSVNKTMRTGGVPSAPVSTSNKKKVVRQ